MPRFFESAAVCRRRLGAHRATVREGWRSRFAAKQRAWALSGAGLALLILPVLAWATTVTPCAPAIGAPRLDHVVLAVEDLDAAEARVRAAGFRVKAGRLHANHLLNRHVKFTDGTAVELMTVMGEPLDAMARAYAGRISDGDGGAYVALRTEGLDRVVAVAREAGLDPVVTRTGRWTYVAFPDSSDAGAVFFGSGWQGVRDPDSLVIHASDVTGLAEAVLEGGPRLERLLHGLGAGSCGAHTTADGRRGTLWRLGHGSLVIVPAMRPVPRVLAAALAGRAPATAADSLAIGAFVLRVGPAPGHTSAAGK